MVFKAYHLARVVISKTFPHGYGQTLVAATQSSATTHNSHFSSLSTNFAQFFGSNRSAATAEAVQNVSAIHPASGNNAARPAGDKKLDAYYAAWQQHQRGEDRELHEFQFAKRIGWKAPTTVPEVPGVATPARPTATRQRPSTVSLHRTKSTSAIDDLRITHRDAEEQAAVDEAEDLPFLELPPLQKTATHDASTVPSGNVSEPQAVNTAETGDVSSISSSFGIPSPAQSTQATSVSDDYTDQLASLAEASKHAEIPPVFEHMLQNGVSQPSPTAYNALLLSAINLPRGKHQVVPRVLDVYSDMLKRRVAPDTSTYAILIEVLAARAMEVYAMQNELLQNQRRYRDVQKPGRFLFDSDDTEFKILLEDESLSLAIKLFDTSAASKTLHVFPTETYCLLISACAEQTRINDMVRIYAEMESLEIVPPTAIFGPMIQAFASTGDLRSAVECYEEYKALAIAHDQGLKTIDRRDDDVYAAVVKAYTLCNQVDAGLKFFGKIQDALQSSPVLPAIQNAVALQALLPEWSADSSYEKALEHASQQLSSDARVQGLAVVCEEAADKDNIAIASKAFELMSALGPAVAITTSAAALLAAHVRTQDLTAAQNLWQEMARLRPGLSMIEPTTVYAMAMVTSDQAASGLSQSRQMFARIRSGSSTTQERLDAIERIDEAIGMIGRSMLKNSQVPPPAAALELVQMMSDNGSISNGLAEYLLATVGPEQVVNLTQEMHTTLLQVQASLLLDRPQLDVGHADRLCDLVRLSGTKHMPIDARTFELVDKALVGVGRLDQAAKWQAKWQAMQQPPPAPFQSPGPQSMVYSPPTSVASFGYEENYDPYANSTDFKGSASITEELEKSYGRHSAHLNEALVKFKNMRRAGRHPRYVTYAKLINAAAKENRINLAHDILAMAKQDVPLLPQSRVVAHGWVSILDAMVGACLTTGKRDVAAQFHQELLSMGAAPSANTFGLYITTLKESTKTFDEATEAVKIFQRAQTEGVEPTSFLYNALIGKLGKARRIDDCLFYFAEMRKLGIRPTSVTYGTIVNALCRVSDDKFAEELFEEMESMPNYKPRPAPYNSLMQYFMTTKRDRSKVLAYYNRMRAGNIQPTMHTYKLLVDTYATLEPVDMAAAEGVLEDIRRSGAQPEAVHYASLIHAKGCVLHDLAGARATFDSVIAAGRVPPQASLYQAIFESMVANHEIAATEPLLRQMSAQGVAMTAYIANTLIHGWALVKDIGKARAVYETLGMTRREPSTYEAMTRAYLAVEDQGNAKGVVGEALRRGYPSAVAGKICDLIGGGSLRS